MSRNLKYYVCKDTNPSYALVTKVATNKGVAKSPESQKFKSKRYNEQSKVGAAREKYNFENNTGNTILLQNKKVNISSLTNMNESTLPLSIQCDTTNCDHGRKAEKEARSNSDIGRGMVRVEEELKSLVSGVLSLKVDNKKISGPNLNNRGSESKALVYKSPERSPKNISPLSFKQNNQMQRKFEVKFNKVEKLCPQPAKKQQLILFSNSTKSSARGASPNLGLGSVGNASARSIEQNKIEEEATNILLRKLSDQTDALNNRSLRMYNLSKNLEILTSSNCETNQLSSVQRFCSEVDATKKGGDVLDLNGKHLLQSPVCMNQIHTESKNQSIKNWQPQAISNPNSLSDQLTLLMKRVESTFSRYEREEKCLIERNNQLLQLLERKCKAKVLHTSFTGTSFNKIERQNCTDSLNKA